MMSQELVAGVLAQVGSGRIVGGWNYVWVSYGLTWAVMVLYALSLYFRAQASRRADANHRAEQEGSR